MYNLVELVCTEEADLQLIRHGEEELVLTTWQAVVLELLHDLADHGRVGLATWDEPEDELVCARRDTLEE
jgi:hypothetical protein